MRHSWTHRTYALAALGFALALAMVFNPRAARAAETPPKVVILGFDGADAELAETWMNEGKLPNLARLRDEGTFAHLRPTVPSQTPVSWSTFATGLDPGRHGIFDFLKRDPKTYRPTFAAFERSSKPLLWGERNPMVFGIAAGVLLAVLVFGLSRLVRLKRGLGAVAALVLGAAAGVGTATAVDAWVPKVQPVPINNRQGATLWEVLGNAGYRVEVIRVPVTFPPKPFEHGELVSGLGTPDLSLRIGKPFYFTSELFFTPAGGGDFSVEVVELVDNQGTIPTEIQGPPNELFPEQGGYIDLPMTLTVPADRSHLEIDVSGNHLSLQPGEWSDWTTFSFPFSPLVKLHGMGRFRLLSLDPEVRLYLSPIQFDPRRLPPILDITTPRSLASDLVDRVGLYKTIGWSIDTWSISDGTVGEDIFLEDVRMTVDKSREMLQDFLKRSSDWDVLVHYFEFTDRVQHMMYRFFDPQHPLYTEEGAQRWGGSILEAYQRMDEIVGETMENLPQGAVLLVVSDHGFASFRRSMNYNTWLAQNGYMTLTGEDAERKNLEDLFDQGDFFVNVDWSRTRAYALGLGQIYINLAGREAQGIVQPGEEYRQLLAELKEGLEGFVDEETGQHPVDYVFTRDEIYGTYDPELIPDLIPSNSEGYRVGWQDSLGGIAKQIVEPNLRVWSGDHCSVYFPHVEGILFSTLGLESQDAYMGDIMPTLLDLYGVAPPEALDGKSLLEGRQASRPGAPEPAASAPGS